MFFLLIPVAWLAIMALLACVCRAAALADRPGEAPAGPIGQRIVLGSVAFSSTPRARGVQHPASPPIAHLRRPSRRRAVAHAGR